MTRFWVFAFAAALSKLGNSFLYVAIPLAVLESTGSSFAAVASLAAQSAPYVLSPLISPLIDRHDRRRLFVASEVAGAALVALIPLFLYLQSLAGVFLMVGLLGLASVISSITSDFVIVPSLVPDRVEWAYSRYNATLQLARLAGPAVAGLAVASVGTWWALWADSATFVVSALAALVLPAGVSRGAGRRAGELRDGARTFFRLPGVWQMTLTLSIYNLGTGGLYSLLLVVGAGSWGWDASRVGLLLSAAAMCSAVGAWVVPRLGASRSTSVQISSWLLVATMGAAALCGQFPVVVAAGYCLLMFADGSLNVTTMVFRQRQIPDAYVGRVNAWIRMFLQGAIAISGVLAATAVELTGYRYAFIVPALLVAISLAFWALMRPREGQAGPSDGVAADASEGALFGTDGIRGKAGAVLTPDLARLVAVAAASTLDNRKSRPLAAVGRDTRVSGEALADAFIDGLLSAGVDVVDLGVTTTPMTAFASREHGADITAMVTASHNPPDDNGIKLFNHRGHKLSDAEQEKIAAATSTLAAAGGASTRPPARRARARQVDAMPEYATRLLGHLPTDLPRLRLVIDCGQGGASAVARTIFAKLPIDAELIHADGDGSRINVNCGATDTTDLRSRVRQIGADGGFAFDGDADRCMAVDETGETIAGEQLLGLLALGCAASGGLTNGRVVTTVASNLGLDACLTDAGVEVTRVPVGDRHVSAAMRDSGSVLGGESSGHIIVGLDAPCGDGLLTALLVIREMVRSGRRMSELASQVTLLPHDTFSVAVSNPTALLSHRDFEDDVRSAESRIGEAGGRVLVRASGTEPRVRVLVEGDSSARVRQVSEELRRLVTRRAGEFEELRT